MTFYFSMLLFMFVSLLGKELCIECGKWFWWSKNLYGGYL